MVESLPKGFWNDQTKGVQYCLNFILFLLLKNMFCEWLIETLAISILIKPV